MSFWVFKTGQPQVSIVSILLRVFIFFNLFGNLVYSIQTTEMRQCLLKPAELCFERLFGNMPICSENELTFRCHHFKVLDNCFREHKTMCSPATIGYMAKTAYRQRLIICARQNQKKYRDAPAHLKSTPTILRYHPPSELQFISLFGYLQTQCTTKPNANCSNEDFKLMTSSCENSIRQQSHLINSDLDRHQLLRLKLDTSSRLLPYAETQRSEECLIVRSALSSIFEIHKKYCLQSIVTKCLCQRLNFEYFCDIECSNLELTTLPFDQKVSWAQFKGRLVGSGSATRVINNLIIILFQFVFLIRIL